MSKFLMKCPDCSTKEEVDAPIGTTPTLLCIACTRMMQVTFEKESLPPVNFGWRGDGHYATQTDSDIAKYQFENL